MQNLEFSRCEKTQKYTVEVHVNKELEWYAYSF